MNVTTGPGLRSSMESFLDQYQLLRVALSGGGVILVAAVSLTGGWQAEYAVYLIAMAVVAGHAGWSRMRRIRSPRPTLFLDLTVWGSIMVFNADFPVVNSSSLVFLTVLAVLFAEGGWLAFFLVYVAGWYGVSFFSGAGVDRNSIGIYFAVLLTSWGIAAVMSGIRRWLGRLDANRSQMLGTVSHELRNSLTGMLGLTELVGTEDLSPEEARELVGLAHQQAVEAAEIVEDLLTVSRIERSALDVALESVDVNQEVETVVRRFAGEGTDVEQVLDPTVTEVVGDPLRVRQVLRNLISNGVRYGGDHIRVSTHHLGDVAEVTVADDGDGVPPEDEKTIFLPYRRSTATRRDPGSIGLGLWICRQLAHAMGGRLEYQRVDGWTRFTLTLPANRDSLPSEAPSTGTVDARTSTLGPGSIVPILSHR